MEISSLKKKFSKKVLKSGSIRLWGSSSIKKLSFSLVKTELAKKWNLKGQMEMELDGDMFYFGFHNDEDRSYVLDEAKGWQNAKGKWVCKQKPIPAPEKEIVKSPRKLDELNKNNTIDSFSSNRYAALITGLDAIPKENVVSAHENVEKEDEVEKHDSNESEASTNDASHNSKSNSMQASNKEEEEEEDEIENNSEDEVTLEDGFVDQLQKKKRNYTESSLSKENKNPKKVLTRLPINGVNSKDNPEPSGKIINCMNNGDKDPRGRVWILWDPNCLKVSKITSTNQFIQTYVNDLANNTNYFLTIVYARNARLARTALWNDLSDISYFCKDEWILLGDFNTCREARDKVEGSKLHPRDVRDLNDFMTAVELDELPTVGDFYSWSNRSVGEGRILIRIDRCLVNPKWQSTFSDSFVNYLHQVTGHDHPSFLPLVQDVWNAKVEGNPMIRLISKLKLLREILKAWSKKLFGNLSERTKLAKENLNRIEEEIQKRPLDLQLAEMEKKR
ncbi:hypothetical protein FRX31_024805 [Thalictrum thalictroides]|uniref:Dnase i-like superfamily protein n=1 Tax=Thalictrum thalictroides TaxID=46969 RepID=A0A7J6VLY4_THATH|nr:hypothetical protein FRX31_024805 [Thalictrum thalictroides]